MDSTSEERNAAALPPMALLATLQTAAHVHGAVQARRDGRDPSAQEPADAARTYLGAAAEQLTRLHMQLLMAKVQAERERDERTDDADEEVESGVDAIQASERLAATVRRFDLLMKLRRTERLLHGTHQRLMSLYPAVSEALVEEARRSHRGVQHLPDVPLGDFDERLGLFLQRLLGLAVWVQREL